ncbi:MAG: hypothetical protein Q9167_000842 [Letrouitia subvulpina]
MNPAAFQGMGMGMAGPGAQATAPTAGQPNNSTGVQNNIFRVLSQQQVPQGWQTTVPIQNRMMVVWQLVSSLRLLNPPTNDQQAIQIAISFETKAFQNCPDKHTYDRTYRSKLQEITETRKRQAAEAQHQMPNNQHQPVNMTQHQLQMQQMAQRQGQSPFQHGPQNGQAAPLMHTPSMPISHQPMGRPQPQQFSLGHPQPAMPQAQLNTVQQMAQQMAQLSPEERQIITRMAQQLLQNTSQQNLENFQNNARNMSQEMKDLLARQGMDPLTYVFRSQALKRYLNAQRGGQAMGVPPGMSLMNGQPRPMSQNAMQNPGQLVAGAQGPQNFEPPFEQIIGQQQDGLRSQEAGQPVVPASNGQPNMGPRGMTRPPTQQQPNVPTAGNHPMPNQNLNQAQPQQFWNAQQPSEMAQGNNISGSTQPTNFGNVTPVPNSTLTGQNFSLNDQMSRAPSQNPPMPTLNKPTAPPGPTQPPQNMWSQNRTNQMNNAHAQNLSLASQAPQQRGLPQEGLPQQPQQPQARPQPSLMNIPPQFRQQLMNMPEETRRNFLNQMQRRRQQQMELQQRGTQPQTFPPMPGPAITPQQSVTQVMSGAQPAFSQQVPLANPPGAPQQRQSQPGAQNQRPGQGPLNSLTEEQQKLMDKQKFPSGILNATSPLSQMPKDVETWGQLKAWVQQNASTLPQGSLNKLKSLQGIHYQSLSQPGLRHSAPEAPMVSHASSVAPQIANSSGIPSIAVPTAEELQIIRPQLPQHFKAATDEQLRAMIMRQRQIEIERARGLQGQPSANGAQKKMSAPNGQPIPGPSRTNFAVAKPSAQKDQAVKQSPSTRSTAPTPKQPAPSKGVKRPSPDEVVEIPNSNRVQAQGPMPQPAPSGSSQAQDEQKARFDAQRQFPLQKPSVQPQMENQAKAVQPTEEMRRRDMRLKQLMAEVSSSLPPRKPVQMTAQQKELMASKLQEMKQMVQRMEMSLSLYFRTVNDESSVISLIKTRNILKSQYQDGQGNPSDNFTITHEELDRHSNQLKQYFHFIMTRMSKSSAGGQQNQQVTQPQNQSASLVKAPPLSAANLQEQQNRLQAARNATVNQQRNHAKQHGNQPPPAPTTAQPPFSLDPQSPRGQGVPIYGSQTLTRLNLPPNPKRQRTTSVPPPVPATPPTKASPLATKPSSPEVQRTPAPASTLTPSVTFRCPVTTCQASIKGFTTQAELDQHRTATHEPQEPVVEDPVGFALESMRQALGLDENGKSKPPKEKEQLEAPKMKISASAQSNAGVKTEVSTPLGRTLTQTGPSPSANLLKTPQTTSIKTPASEAKPSSSKDTKSKPSKEALETPKDSAPSPFDPWSNSSVSPEAIASAWSSLTEMHNLSSFTKIQGVTPSSTLSSLENKSEKNSPHASDISENDAVKINIDVRGAGAATVDEDKSDSWIPAEWFEDTLYGGIDNLNFDGDTMMQGMDWDIFGDESDIRMDQVGGTGKGKGKGDGASEEWLKVYAPERVSKS